MMMSASSNNNIASPCCGSPSQQKEDYNNNKSMATIKATTAKDMGTSRDDLSRTYTSSSMASSSSSVATAPFQDEVDPYVNDDDEEIQSLLEKQNVNSSLKQQNNNANHDSNSLLHKLLGIQQKEISRQKQEIALLRNSFSSLMIESGRSEKNGSFVAAAAATTTSFPKNIDDGCVDDGDNDGDDDFEHEQRRTLRNKTRFHRLTKLNLEQAADEESSNIYTPVVDDAMLLPSSTGSRYVEDNEGIEIPLIPEDTNSFIAFAKCNSITLYISIAVIVIQVTTMTLVLIDIFSLGTPNNRLDIPPGVSWTTSTIQIIAMLIIVLGQTDVHDSLNTLYIGFNKDNLYKELDADVTYGRWMLSLITRIFVALLALMTTFFMMVSEDDTTQLLLDFASIEFVTNVDNLVFWLCAWGYLGVTVQHDAAKICNAKKPIIVTRDKEDADKSRFLSTVTSAVSSVNVDINSGGFGSGKRNDDMKKSSIINNKSKRSNMAAASKRRTISVALRDDKSNNDGDLTKYVANGPFTGRKLRKRSSRCLFLVTIFLIMACGWAVVLYRQSTGYYVCETVHIQFNDDFAPKLAVFSGLYDRCHQGTSACKRGHYQERGHGVLANTAQIGYCRAEKAWAFSHLYDLSDEHDVCKWAAKSARVDPFEGEAFDIMGSANIPWMTRNRAGTTVPLPSFSLQCFDCKHDADFCGGSDQGECINNRCVCKEGWYGIRCEFPEPCDELEVDPHHPPFHASREYARTFQRIKIGHNSSIAKQVKVYDRLAKGVNVYDRPIYLGRSIGGYLDLLFYNGRRWAMISGTSRTLQGLSRDEVIEMATSFHGYWSDYTERFLSVPVDIDTPGDASTPVDLTWFHTQTVEEGDTGVSQFPDTNRPIETKLLCTTCTNETSINPCLYGGMCSSDGRCVCTNGSSGKLCQIAPVGNGLCNQYFNTPEFGYDGGDCCEDTCVNGEHECGKGIIGDEFGVQAYGYIGFDDCADPSVTSKVSGSPTLHDILQRGYLKCGTHTNFLNEFQAGLCGALAAAIFGDATAMELTYFEPEKRFAGVLEGQHDVLFATDHTASRDIFESSSQSPFSFSYLSYFYGGLLFAGIPPFVHCADNGDYESPECQGMKICVLGDTTWYDATLSVFHEENVFGLPTMHDIMLGLSTGLCNVVGGFQGDIDEEAARQGGFVGSEYEVGTKLYTKSFEGFVTAPDDRVWSKFVSWVLEALVAAEESGITKATADQMVATDAFGLQFLNMFRDAVQANGNYGEIWEKTLSISRAGLNSIYDGNSSAGLLLSSPFGNVNNQGPAPRTGGTIERILSRGHLKIGISDPNQGFATFDGSTWSGFFIDIGKGIAAGLFGGQVNLEVVPLSSSLDRFTALAGNAVDIVVPSTRNLAREMKDPVTGEAFDFTSPIFYDGMQFAGPLPYGRCADDLQFGNYIELSYDCRQTIVCVPEGSSWLEAMRNGLGVPEGNFLTTSSVAESISKLYSGECNAIAYETAVVTFEDLPEALQPFHVGVNKHTKEPLAVMSRSDDPQFSDIVWWIVNGFIHAEEHGITSEAAASMPKTMLFGEALEGIWVDSVRAVGNYGEMFDRNFDGVISRNPENRLNDLTGPRLYASPGTAI